MHDISPRPLAAEELVDDLALLAVRGVGSIIYQRLYSHFGTAAAAISSSPNEWRQLAGISVRLAESLRTARERRGVDEVLKLCAAQQITILSVRDPRYPRRLRTIHNPPPILYARGSCVEKLSEVSALAIVGTRRATDEGLIATKQIASELARAGIIVTSGLAYGIDAAAHRGALAAGKETIAILGGGVLNVTPTDHHELAAKIVECGALLSEYPPLQPPTISTFPQRNRIVSGMSFGVLVTEAPANSGALITAKLAREHGRLVFAMLRENADAEDIHGCRQLIKTGAIQVENVNDILTQLTSAPVKNLIAENVASKKVTQEKNLWGDKQKAIPISASEKPSEKSNEKLNLKNCENLAPPELAICEAVALQPLTIDEIIAQTSLPVGVVLATISQLEIRRLIRRGAANRIFHG